MWGRGGCSCVSIRVVLKQYRNRLGLPPNFNTPLLQITLCNNSLHIYSLSSPYQRLCIYAILLFPLEYSTVQLCMCTQQEFKDNWPLTPKLYAAAIRDWLSAEYVGPFIKMSIMPAILCHTFLIPCSYLAGKNNYIYLQVKKTFSNEKLGGI